MPPWVESYMNRGLAALVVLSMLGSYIPSSIASTEDYSRLGAAMALDGIRRLGDFTNSPLSGGFRTTIHQWLFSYRSQCHYPSHQGRFGNSSIKYHNLRCWRRDRHNNRRRTTIWGLPFDSSPNRRVFLQPCSKYHKLEPTNIRSRGHQGDSLVAI